MYNIILINLLELKSEFPLSLPIEKYLKLSFVRVFQFYILVKEFINQPQELHFFLEKWLRAVFFHKNFSILVSSRISQPQKLLSFFEKVFGVVFHTWSF